MRFATLAAVVAVAGAFAAESARGELRVQVAGGGDTLADGHPCASAVSERLQRHGLTLEDMEEVRWYTDRFAREGGATGPVNTIRFYGRPASCAKGSVAITMGAGCGIQNVRTRGGCEIAGLGC